MIALDAMGGDRGPEILVAGAEVARIRRPDVTFLIFGDRARIGPPLDRYPGLAAVSAVRHTTEAVAVNPA